MNALLARSQILLLIVALAVLCGINFGGLSRPPFDAHNFRQSQTLATIELFAQEGIDLLHPRTNYVGEPGIFVLELPIFQAVCAAAYRAFGDHIAIVRTLNILLSLGSAAALFAIGRRRLGRDAAFAAVLLFLFGPLNLLYMSSTLIDPGAVCCALWSFYSADTLLGRQPGDPPSSWRWALLTLLCVLTALVKALYLFPLCVLMAGTAIRDRTVRANLVRVSFSMALAGAAFLAWNRYSASVNDSSFFTRGINPTSLLGLSQLGEIAFYRTAARRLVLELLGPAGGILAVVGWVVAVLPRSRAEGLDKFFLIVCGFSVFGYWLVFANITHPHDYYSLIALPFAALPAGAACALVGAGWARLLKSPQGGGLAVCACAVLAALAGIAAFFAREGARAYPSLIHFEQLCAGRFARWEYAMIFIGPEQTPGGAPLHEAPAMLYAAGLRGTAQVVSGPAQAQEQWRLLRPHYRNLRYVIFFGLPAPEEIARDAGNLLVREERDGFAAFDLH